MMVLSGMSNIAMVEDNCGYMKDFQPLNEEEMKAVEQVSRILRQQENIECTGCRYCTEVCPQGIPIPELFSCLNNKRLYATWDADHYARLITDKGAKASDCIQCGACESACPQHLAIRSLLEEAADEFEE